MTLNHRPEQRPLSQPLLYSAPLGFASVSNGMRAVSQEEYSVRTAVANDPFSQALGRDSQAPAKLTSSGDFDAARRDFLDELRIKVETGSRSANTLWTYDKRLEFFERQMGVESWSQVDRPLVSRYLLGLRNGNLPDSRRPSSDHTIQHHWTHLVSFFKWARRRGYPVDPSLFELDDRGKQRFAIEQPLAEELDPKAWEPWEVTAIRHAAHVVGPRAQLTVELLLRTGVRLSELANIKLDDIQGSNIRIGGSKSTRGRKVRTMRYVPLYPEVRNMVQVWVERYRPVSTLEYLLLQLNGKRLTARGIDSMLDRLHAMAGVSSGGAHRYRHTFGTEFLKHNPGQFKKLKDIMGHSDWRTLERYAKYRPVDLADPGDDPFAR